MRGNAKEVAIRRGRIALDVVRRVFRRLAKPSHEASWTTTSGWLGKTDMEKEIYKLRETEPKRAREETVWLSREVQKMRTEEKHGDAGRRKKEHLNGQMKPYVRRAADITLKYGHKYRAVSCKCGKWAPTRRLLRKVMCECMQCGHEFAFAELPVWKRFTAGKNGGAEEDPPG